MSEELERATAILQSYATASLVSDEAELLRGCLYALVSIARGMQEDQDEDERHDCHDEECICHDAGTPWRKPREHQVNAP